MLTTRNCRFAIMKFLKNVAGYNDYIFYHLKIYKSFIIFLKFIIFNNIKANIFISKITSGILYIKNENNILTYYIICTSKYLN